MENDFQSRSQQASSRSHIQQKIKKGDTSPFFSNNNVYQVNFQIHLGVILDVKLTFEEHLKNVINKTNKTIELLINLYNLLRRHQDKLQSLFTKHLFDLIQIMVMYSMTKLLIILSTQKWNPLNIMPVQQVQEPYEVRQEKKSTRNQAQSLSNLVFGVGNFVCFIKFSKINIQNTYFI